MIRTRREPAEPPNRLGAWWKKRRIGIGKGAEVAGMLRAAFMKTLGEHGVAVIDYPVEDLREELHSLGERRSSFRRRSADLPRGRRQARLARAPVQPRRCPSGVYEEIVVAGAGLMGSAAVAAASWIEVTVGSRHRCGFCRNSTQLRQSLLPLACHSAQSARTMPPRSRCAIVRSSMNTTPP